MKRTVIRLGLLAALLASPCLAQWNFNIFLTGYPALNTFLQSLVAAQNGTSLPATCTLGKDFYFYTGSGGPALYYCSATNVWTATQGGGSGFALQNSGTTIGSGLTTLNVQPDASTIVTTSVGGTTGNVKYAINTATIPNIAASQAGLSTVADTGASGTAYAGCPTTTITTLTNGMEVTLIPAHAATGGATTFNLCTLGAVAVAGWGTSNPAANDLLVNRPVKLRYDSSFFGGAWVYTPDGTAPSGGGTAPAPVFGAYASRPACASTNTGQLFHASDIGNKHWECDGTTWQPVAFDMQVVEPTALTWSTMVGGGSNTPTITSVAGAVQLSAANPGGSGYNFQGMLTPLSMTTPYTIEIAFTLEQLSMGQYSICQWGVADGNSPASNFLGQAWGNPAGGGAETVFYSTFNSIGVGARGIQAPPIVSQPVTRVKMVDDGTNRGWYYNTGSGWHLQFSEGDTVDVSSPTYWGIGCSLYGTNDQFQLTLYHASVHH